LMSGCVVRQTVGRMPLVGASLMFASILCGARSGIDQSAGAGSV
jgi:hypothetical protein